MFKKSPLKKRLGTFSIIIIAILAAIALSVPTYIVFDWCNNNVKLSFTMIATIYSGILYIVIVVILSILLSILSKQHAHAKELKNFKNFTDVLHRSSSEIEVYETLYTFVRNMHLVNHVTLFYRNDRSANDITWQRITNERMPLCRMEPRNCPLIKYGRECYVKNIATDITCAYQLSEHKAGSYVCLPITNGNLTLGILQLYTKSRYFFDDTIISKLKSYIEVAKPIISSKKTLHQLNKKATTDKLTKLYNRSFLEQYLENQIETSSKLSVIMLDIDHFKRINDTYGHAAGDAVLVVFSQVILRCLRRTDLVARYGGEEFIAILPATDTGTALSIAERIRESVATEPMPKINNIQIPNITCSLGVSAFPIFATNKNTLLKTADVALYKAKQSGRNCVKLYTKEMGI
ncbi:MAG: GGDEF domain-containing protein [Clostridium sp.]|nr:GGDEF domain-containing protein [Clostridium sp.]